MGRLWLTLTAGVLLAASPALAEERDPPRFEIGASVSGILPLAPGEGPVMLVGAGPGIVVNITRRFGVGALAEVFGPSESSLTTAVYETTLKVGRRDSPRGAAGLSFKIGAAGFAAYRRGDERRVERPDRSTVVYPAYRTIQVLRPNMLTAGVVRDQVITPHLSTSLGMQAYVGQGGMALRLFVGVSLGAGGYR